MSDDLVKRLREKAFRTETYELFNSAADRIEKLEAQLAQSQLKRWAAIWEEQSDSIEKLETLVEQLRDDNSSLIDDFDKTFLDQESRIEQLEAALREIIDERGICGHCGQLATGEGKRSFVICDKTVLGFKGPCHWTPQDPKDIARKALEGKDD
jgi:hypothetical protein